MLILVTNGRSYSEMYLFRPRLKTSFSCPSMPLVSDFDQVKLRLASRPCESRLITLACKELYQLSPNGAHSPPGAVVNCGNGRRDCATVAVSGKFEYGSLFMNGPAAGLPIGAARMARAA